MDSSNFSVYNVSPYISVTIHDNTLVKRLHRLQRTRLQVLSVLDICYDVPYLVFVTLCEAMVRFKGNTSSTNSYGAICNV